MLEFERKYNKEREEKNKRLMCFACHREGHSIQTCFKIFPQLKNSDGGGQQERRSKPKYEGYKGKKKAQAMQALFSDSEAEKTDSESESEEETNLALMASVDEGPSTIDMHSIIASKNITDETTIDFLMDLAKSRNSKREDDEIETSTSSANEVHSNPCFLGYETEQESSNEGGDEYSGTIDIGNENYIITNENKNDLHTNRLETNDACTFTNNILMHYDDESRLQSLLDESNRTLVEKEGIIQELIHKNDMLELENKRLKASHLGEIGILKVKIQTLETEKGALRSTSEVSYVTRLDPYHVDNLIKSHKMDKSGLGFEKGKSSFESNHNKGPKEKGEHSQTSRTKFKFNGEQYSTYQFFTKKGITPLNKEPTKLNFAHTSNAKQDKKSPNHAFRYKYNNKNYKNKKNFQSSNKNTFNPKGSNKTYFKGPDGWFYEIKNKIALQNQTQRNGLARDVPQHHNKVNSNKTKSVTSRVANISYGSHKSNVHKLRYQPMFNQGSTSQKQSTTMCNYCCHLGHISLECKFRNPNNKQNVVWAPKAILA